jgi:hypothetical protein
MSEPERGNQTAIQEFLEEIEHEVDEGERLLQDVRLRKQVELALEPDFSLKEAQPGSRELMIELTLIVLGCLADPLGRGCLERLVAHLNPLGNIRDILSRERLNTIVALRPVDVVLHSRMSKKDFAERLRHHLAAAKRAVRNMQRRTPDRTITGFAPAHVNKDTPRH